ncbi:MAG: MmgE/PrpD family protein, partial [Dehalococcoidia bacterium]|nr:MmgE/PrpD family protein [Dehalococcoidia bacterium]
MANIAERLSSYATTLRYEELPPEVVHLAKRMIIDTLGCGLGGYDGEPSRIARETAGMVTSSVPATVIGSGLATSPDMATFANGVMIRYLDYNDGY